MKKNEQPLNNECPFKQEKLIDSKKEWEEPQLIVLDSKNTFGKTAVGPPEDSTYRPS